MKILYNSSDEI